MDVPPVDEGGGDGGDAPDGAAAVAKGKPKAKPKPKHKVKAKAAPIAPPDEIVAHKVFKCDVRGDGLPLLRFDTKLNKLAAHCKHPLHGNLCRMGRGLDERAGMDAGSFFMFLLCIIVNWIVYSFMEGLAAIVFIALQT